MPFAPDEFGRDASPLLEEETAGDRDGAAEWWSPLFRHACSFNPAIFDSVMLNLIKNPNINSSWLFRADILSDRGGRQHLVEPCQEEEEEEERSQREPRIPAFQGFRCEREMIRRLIPRNTVRDEPLDQTCLFYKGVVRDDDDPVAQQRSLVIYLPHVSSEDELPFYHPTVRGIAFLHEWAPEDSSGVVSIHYLFFSGGSTRSPRLVRTALHLLSALHKHGEGACRGYVKRVQHDVLVPQARLQDRYAVLKKRYARELVTSWAESTDPAKHVFEDLCIAAFLMELWVDMYRDVPFSGFVDIGCGNGLLVHILNREGYPGWGFDARSRKSWRAYTIQLGDGSDSLRQLVLLPSPIIEAMAGGDKQRSSASEEGIRAQTHDGSFPPGTFIISNHADELTPWTPILATVSQCPFIMIPCCSHALSGAKFRAPMPKGTGGKQESAYATLVAWVSDIATDCGWEPEREMLRIPSTRNTAIIGRRRAVEYADIDVQGLITNKYGGTGGYIDNVMKLVQKPPSGH